jgi:hypothetical protein
MPSVTIRASGFQDFKIYIIWQNFAKILYERFTVGGGSYIVQFIGEQLREYCGIDHRIY